MDSAETVSTDSLEAVVGVWRRNHCLGDAAIGIYRRWIHRYLFYCEVKGLAEHSQLTRAGVESFARWYARSRRIDRRGAEQGARGALHTWASARQTLGEVLPPWVPPFTPTPPSSRIVSEFMEHLRAHRGNPEVTIRKKIAHIKEFLNFLGTRRFHQLQLSDIDAFVVTARRRLARTTVADMCSSLRSFLRFLRASGRISTDLASSVMAPVVRRGERPVRALPWDDVRRILNAIDPSTTCGLRDAALFLMMSTYGLGAGEVTRLTLDDINWRAATLQITRPKTGVTFVLPLLPPIAEALAHYLRGGRPAHAPTRHVFVRMNNPHSPLSGSSPIRHRLVALARRAGVSAPYLGAHVLRHSHACRQMELGTPPKLIGDILGHRDPDSTSAYLRVSMQRLREMALAVPS